MPIFISQLTVNQVQVAKYLLSVFRPQVVSRQSYISVSAVFTELYNLGTLDKGYQMHNTGSCFGGYYGMICMGSEGKFEG